MFTDEVLNDHNTPAESCTSRMFDVVQTEDGIIRTDKPVPAGLGRLVHFSKEFGHKFSFIASGLVMISSVTTTTIFTLGRNNAVTTKDKALFEAKSLYDCGGSLLNEGKILTKFCLNWALGSISGPYSGGADFDYSTKPASRVKKGLSGVSDRLSVWKACITGVKIIDCLFPIGLGQRQLIIGDRCTGKTSIATDAIIAQRRTNLKCVYVSIGQKSSMLIKVVRNLQKQEAMHYTSIVAANAAEPVALQFLAPYAGCSLAEVFSSLGGDSLIIYDDLSKHAVAYRQMALLLRKSPGREAFPSDIFYLHSSLLERAGQFFTGSLTALPIIEILCRDVSAYVPTNVISITDGQIFLDSNYFNKGSLPAIHISLSVSRIGSKSQYPCMIKVSKWVKSKITEFRKMENLLSFVDDVDQETFDKLRFGWRLNEFLGQPCNEPVSIYDQILLFGLIYRGLLRYLDLSDI